MSEIHPNSLKNLDQGKWKPGQSGNPKGRPSVGSSIIELMNDYGEKTSQELQDIASSPESKAKEVAAALRMIASMAGGDDNRQDVAFAIDYTNGKPTQHITQEVERHDTRTLKLETRPGFKEQIVKKSEDD